MDRQEVIDILTVAWKENIIPSFLNAKLAGIDLERINLECADLQYADLAGTNLTDACLMQANLIGANLIGAKLESANLRGANLTDARLNHANLTDADLREVTLLRANLEYTDLKNAVFRGANVYEIDIEHSKNIPDYLIAVTCIVPEGGIIGWKKLRDDKIAKLSIPADAHRSNATGRKCRAEFVDVLEIWNGYDSVLDGMNILYPFLTFHVGERTHCKNWDTNRWKKYGNGIDFFLTRYEAEQSPF